MPDILQDLPIDADCADVFRAVTDPAELDGWWTMTCAGQPREGAEYDLGFGPGYDWRARVISADPPRHFELEFVHADADWLGSRVGFRLEQQGDSTLLHFSHTGWRDANAHYRVSSHCWALYLRLLRRYLEQGEVVAYDRRLAV